jgi:cytidylate kinase
MAKTKSHVKTLKIAIDGPVGAGKSTVAQLVAERLGFLYLDTGAMYRAATWLALKNQLPIDDGDAIASAVAKAKIKLEPGDESTGNRVRVFVDDHEVTREIRTSPISDLVSPVSALSQVRRVLVAQQKEMAKPGGVVLDGRDIGTVVMPDADIKVFLTASPQERARRRMKDLNALGEHPDMDSLTKSIEERDHRDSTRADSPLAQAHDAVVIITDNLSIDQVVDAIVRLLDRGSD